MSTAIRTHKALGANRCAKSLSERFHMPLIYERDVEWANIMQKSVEAGIASINTKPMATFQEIIGVMIDTARPELTYRAERFSGDESGATKIEHHASDFGVPRTGSQRWTPLIGKLEFFKTPAIESLKQFGSYSEQVKTWGQDSSRAGQAFIKVTYSLQALYETPSGPVKLCEVKSSWIPTHENEENRKPWNKIDIISPEVTSAKPMLDAADALFERVKQLKKSIEKGQIEKDKALVQTVSYASEIYWMISQAWPYKRGSAAIADLAAKMIFDWIGIKTPLWRDDANPNILALIYPLGKFQEVYRGQHQGDFTWMVSK